MEPHENWIPIIMFAGLAVIVSLFLYYRYRSRQDLQQTIRTAIDKGQELSPEIVERLGSPPVSPDRDLRRGLLGVLLAVGFALFAVIIGEEDAVRPMLGTAMFPLSIGAAFLLMHRFGRRK